MNIEHGSLAHHLLSDAYQKHIFSDDAQDNFLYVDEFFTKHKEHSPNEIDRLTHIIFDLKNLGCITSPAPNKIGFYSDFDETESGFLVTFSGHRFDRIIKALDQFIIRDIDGKILGVPRDELLSCFPDWKSDQYEDDLDLLIRFDKIHEGIVTFPNGESEFYYSVNHKSSGV